MGDELETKVGDTPSDFTSTRRSTRVIPKMPKAAAIHEKTSSFVGGLRLPLANIQKPKTAELQIPKGVQHDSTTGAGKKKRRLLNQVTVDGSDAAHASLLFGTGYKFGAPE